MRGLGCLSSSNLIVLLAVSVGAMSNATAAHPPAIIRVRYDLNGSTDTSFLLGITVSVVASLAPLISTQALTT